MSAQTMVPMALCIPADDMAPVLAHERQTPAFDPDDIDLSTVKFGPGASDYI